MEDYSKAAFIVFLNMIVEKGLVNANTGNGWRVAASKVLEDLADHEDVRGVDVHRAVLMYNNRNKNILAPASMKQYEIRVGQAIENFKRWASDQMSYRGPSRQGGTRPDKNEGRRKNGGPARPSAETATIAPPVQPDMVHHHTPDVRLTMPFPLRPTFLAQLVIPRDMTKDEAKRLCAFVEALAHDPAPK